MKRVLVTAPLAGCLLLAIVALAPGVILEAATARSAWQVAFDLRPEKPRCWSVNVLSYCRVDHARGAGDRLEQGSIHFITTAPLPDRVQLIRSNTWWGRITVTSALDQLRERAAIVMGLVALLGWVVHDFAIAGIRQLAPAGDIEERMAAAGWRAGPPVTDAGAAPRSRSAHRQEFGRRH